MQIAHPKFRVWNQKHTWKIRGGYFPSQNFCGSRQCSNLSSVYTYLEFLQFNALVSSNYIIRILEHGFQFSTLFCVFFAANLTKIQTTVKFSQVPNIKRFAVIFCQYLIYFFFKMKTTLAHFVLIGALLAQFLVVFDVLELFNSLPLRANSLGFIIEGQSNLWRTWMPTPVNQLCFSWKTSTVFRAVSNDSIVGFVFTGNVRANQWRWICDLLQKLQVVSLYFCMLDYFPRFMFIHLTNEIESQTAIFRRSFSLNTRTAHTTLYPKIQVVSCMQNSPCIFEISCLQGLLGFKMFATGLRPPELQATRLLVCIRKYLQDEKGTAKNMVRQS